MSLKRELVIIIAESLVKRQAGVSHAEQALEGFTYNGEILSLCGLGLDRGFGLTKLGGRMRGCFWFEILTVAFLRFHIEARFTARLRRTTFSPCAEGDHVVQDLQSPGVPAFGGEGRWIAEKGLGDARSFGEYMLLVARRGSVIRKESSLAAELVLNIAHRSLSVILCLDLLQDGSL